MDKILDEVTVTLFERVEQENSRDKDKSKKIRERKKKERKGRKGFKVFIEDRWSIGCGGSSVAAMPTSHRSLTQFPA